ncbi:hypothetical protein A2U01_0119608, partial [Trifolium medium]|nr:hypothetical protein [Trifolium medium]
MTIGNSGANIVGYSESDESMKIASAKKDENEGPEVVVVDDLVAGD